MLLYLGISRLMDNALIALRYTFTHPTWYYCRPSNVMGYMHPPSTAAMQRYKRTDIVGLPVHGALHGTP